MQHNWFLGLDSTSSEIQFSPILLVNRPNLGMCGDFCDFFIIRFVAVRFSRCMIGFTERKNLKKKQYDFSVPIKTLINISESNIIRTHLLMKKYEIYTKNKLSISVNNAISLSHL